MTKMLTRAMFDQNLNAKFKLRHEVYGDIDLELIEVAVSQEASAEYERFSLMFLDRADHPLPQQTYTMEHGEMGEFDLFIVPVKQDERGRYYEAVFNRLAREPELQPEPKP